LVQPCPPVPWWIAPHVREGREKLDFSEWETYSTWQKRDELEAMRGLISTGRMPPRIYTAIHPEAKLTEENKKAVCAWTQEHKDCCKMSRAPKAHEA
jgi:hypothetical protein